MSVNTNLLKDPIEIAFYKTLLSSEARHFDAMVERDYFKALMIAAELCPHMNELLNTLRIHTDEKDIEENRLELIRRASKLMEAVIPLSGLRKKQ